MLPLTRRIALVSARVLGFLSARRPRPRLARPALKLEPLSDRVLFSANLLAGLPFTAQPSDPAVAAAWTAVVQSGDRDIHVGQSALDAADAQTQAQAQPTVDALQSSLTTWTAPPAVTSGELNVGGESYPVLDLQFGSTAQVVLAFGSGGATTLEEPEGSPGVSVLGAGIAVQTATGDQRYLLDFVHHLDWDGIVPPPAPGPYEPPGPGVVPGPNAAGTRGAGDAYVCEQGMSQGTTPCEMMAEMVDPSPTGRTKGSRIADGLARWDGGGSDGMTDGTPDGVEIDAADPDGQTLALVTMDWDLPDAKQELVPLHRANLAVVPTYVVGEAPAPTAPAAAADPREDLRLTDEVVGLDQPPSTDTATGADAPIAAAADELFRNMPFAVGPRGPFSQSAEEAPPTNAAVPLETFLSRFASQCDRLFAELAQPDAQTTTTAAQAVAAEALLSFGLWRLSWSN